MIRIFSHWLHWKTLFQIVLDLAFPVVCVLGSVLVAGLGGQERIGTVVLFAFIFSLAMVVLNGWLGLYSRGHGRAFVQTRARAVLSLYLSIPLAFCTFYLLSITDTSQELLLLSCLAALFGTLAHRVHAMHTPAGSMRQHRVMIFGTGHEAMTVGMALKKTDPSVNIVGYYPGSSDVGFSVAERFVLDRDQTLSGTVQALKVHEVIIAVTERRGGNLPLSELLDCKLSGVRVFDLASYFERALGYIRLDSLHVGWLVFGDGFSQGWGRGLVKRVFDLIAASILLVVSLPIMLVTALLIGLEDGFPILYRQERVGLNGRLFNVVKFRSMRKDAESDGEPRWATANDNRTTQIGRIIRKLRIDELPQLFSVLTGDMSLVGPRPERPYFVDRLTRDIPFYAIRHSVKPGVTGWAQVRYHYGASVEDTKQKLQYDLYYVKNHSLFLDIVILFETVGVVLTAKGAQ